MPNIGTDGWAEIDWICDTAQNPLTNHYQRYEDWYLYNQDMKSAEEEARKITSLKTKLGWSGNGMFKRISSMPLHIFMVLRRIDPEFATNTPNGRKKIYRFVQHRPEFSVK